MVGSSGGLYVAERVDSVWVQEPSSQPGQVYDESGTGVTDIGDREATTSYSRLVSSNG